MGERLIMEGPIVFNDERISLSEYLISESYRKNYVIDTSVVFKWYYKKDEADLYKADILFDLLNSEHCLLLAPKLLIYEILNIFRLKKDINNIIAKQIIADIYELLFFIEMDRDLLLSAFYYSRDLEISLYDGIYIALSRKFDVPLITADKKLFSSIKGKSPKIILLSEMDLS